MASQQGGGGARPKTPRQSPGSMQQASAPTKEGWLIVHETYWKGFVKRQKRRYCVLKGQSRLVIYKDDTKTKFKAIYHLQQALDVTVTAPSSYVFEIRMTGDVPPLVLVSRDKADMLDWIDTLIDDIFFSNGPARHVNSPSQGMTGKAKHQAENRTDSSTCQQSGLSDAEGSGTLQQASMPKKEGWLHGAFWSMGHVKRRIERYCVLEDQSRLVIYKDRTKTKVNAVCPLQQVLDVTVTAPSSYVFEIRMAGDVPPLFLAARYHADMFDWTDTLIDIWFINGPARHVNSPSQGMTGGAKHQTEDRTDPSTSQQSGLSDAEGSGTLQQASISRKEGWLHGAFWSMGRRHIERYCVLEGQSRLVIYKDDTKTKVTAVCPLQQALDVTATAPSSYVFEIRMAGDVPPLVLASHDKADMLDWIYTLNNAFMFINGPARHVNCPSQGMTGGAKHQAENTTDSSTCQQSGLSDAEREFLNAYFPNLHRDVYMIPPHHVDTVHVRKQYTQGGDMIDVLKTQKQIDSDSSKDTEVSDVVHIDRALKKVHCCMDKIKDKAARQKDVLIIMTQGKCGLYGAGSRSLYNGAARNMNSDETEPLLLQEDLVLEENFVDLLVIDRNRGVLMGAIIHQTAEAPHAVQEELRKAADYLQQAGDVVRRCVLGDLDLPQPAVHQAILLPNTTRRCLQEALQSMDDLQKLEQCLGVKAGQGVDSWCLCHDDMTDDTRRDAWWNTCWKGGKAGDPAIKGGSTYEKLVARFSVPLATVQVYLSRKPRLQLWSQGHFVQAVGEEHGRPMSCLALFPEQFEVLEHTPNHDDDDIRIFRGAPGVGKSIILILRGSFWMRKYRRTVFVLQTSHDGTAAAYLVRHQLSKTVGPEAGSVQLVNMAGIRDRVRWTKGGEEGRRTEGGKKKVQTWMEELCQHAQTEGRVHILADEANGDVITEIYKALKQRHITVSLWAAGVLLELPADMERYVHHLTQPLRSPPSVVREVEQARDMKGGKVPAYTAPPVAPPSDGPPVLRVDHLHSRRGDTQGHEGGPYPWECERCGQLVADLLTTLRVGCHDHAPHGQGGLTFNDVFVLGGMNCDTDSPAPFIRGLESRGVPTRKVARRDTAAVRQLAEMTSAPTGEERAAGRGRDEAVTVAHQDTVWGLERPVVVYLEPGGVGDVYNADLTGRLRSMSRSTAQVIWVKTVLI